MNPGFGRADHVPLWIEVHDQDQRLRGQSEDEGNRCVLPEPFSRRFFKRNAGFEGVEGIVSAWSRLVVRAFLRSWAGQMRLLVDAHIVGDLIVAISQATRCNWLASGFFLQQGRPREQLVFWHASSLPRRHPGARVGLERATS